MTLARRARPDPTASPSRRPKSGPAGLVLGLLSLTLAVPTLARAGDGVLEINQACAAGDGCFPGDAPGFPVEINVAAPSGSFRLTSDLVVPDNATRGIRVTRSRVAIDLGGFSILGAACVGTNADCTPAAPPIGTIAHGIDATPLPLTAMSGLHVWNGHIVGMGGKGLSAPPGSRVHDVEARFNAGSGLRLLQGSSLRDCVAAQNGGHGIELDRSATVTRVVAEQNTLDGIAILAFVGESTTVVRDSTLRANGGVGLRAAGEIVRIEGNVVTRNTQGGLQVDSGAKIEGNSVVANPGDGIVCDLDGLITNNTVSDNGGTTGNGIRCNGDCAVRGNLVRGQSIPLSLGLLASGYADNVLFRSGGSAIPGGGVNLGGNLCNGVLCP